MIQNVDPYTISSSRRNPVLADLFGRMDLMERRGSGLKKIIESYEFEKEYKRELKPEFISTQSTFLVILKNLNYFVENEPQNEPQSEPQNEPQKMSRKDRLQKIIELLMENPSITKLELTKILDVTESTIKRDISHLKNIGKIEYVGSSKTGRWIVIK